MLSAGFPSDLVPAAVGWEAERRSTVEPRALAGAPRSSASSVLPGPSLAQPGSPTGAGAKEDEGVWRPPTCRTGSGIRNLQHPRVRRTTASRLTLWPTET